MMASPARPVPPLMASPARPLPPLGASGWTAYPPMSAAGNPYGFGSNLFAAGRPVSGPVASTAPISAPAARPPVASTGSSTVDLWELDPLRRT